MFISIEHRVDQDFQRARRTAMQSVVRGKLRGARTTLLPFEEVSARIGFHGQRDLGLQTVPLDRIVGSEGRANEFDRDFLPRSAQTQSRWTRVARAYCQQVGLPAVELYQLGTIYFVRDGNHRVSVARHQGQMEIDAHVIELLTDIPLTPDLDEAALVGKEAQSAFIQRTGILRLRPGTVVPQIASEPRAYLQLLRHIDGHHYFMGLDQETAISREEAVVHWYDMVYLPQIEAIRRCGGAYGGQTETTLYLRIMDHRHYVTEQTGRDPGPDAAVIDYVLRFGSWGARRQARNRKRTGVELAARDVPATTTGLPSTGQPSWLLQFRHATQRLLGNAS